MKARDDREEHLRRMRKGIELLHPRCWVWVTGLCAVLGIGFSIALQVVGHMTPMQLRRAALGGEFADQWARDYRYPWLSFAIGLVLGLAWIVPYRLYLRRTVPRSGRELFRKGRRWRGILLFGAFCLCWLLSIGAAVGAAWVLKIAMVPAHFGVGVLAFLLYPGQKATHEAAKKALAELERELASGEG